MDGHLLAGRRPVARRPSPVADFRDRDSITWYAARILEGAVVLGAIFVIVHLARGCLRAGRLLTFDVMFCMAGATIFWNDFGMNVFQPYFVISSNFVNVNNTCGHMPFVINPDCGRAPEPILFLFLVETFLVLALVKVAFRLATRARNRWPRISTPKLYGLVLLMGMGIALLELPIIALGVWTYSGPRWMSFSLGHGTQYNVLTWVQTGLFFACAAALYIFRNDKGETLVERGLETHTPRRRKTITLLALYGGRSGA